MGSERGTRLCSDQRARDNKGQTDWGESQISETETAGGRNGKTAGTIRNERGNLGNHRWKEQWPEKTRETQTLQMEMGKGLERGGLSWRLALIYQKQRYKCPIKH